MVSKLISPPTKQEEINKINEIIDNLGGGGLSYSAASPAITISDGVATWAVTHNLGTTDVIVSLYTSGGVEIEKNVTVTSANAISVAFKASSNVTAGAYTIVVLASGADSDTSNLMDKNASNATSTAKKAIDNWGSPNFSSTAAISMGLPTSPVSTTNTTYTCPSAGYCIISAYKSTAGNNFIVDVNGQNVITYVGFSAMGSTTSFPVSKNDVVKAYTNSTTAGWQIFVQNFYPLKGEA